MANRSPSGPFPAGGRAACPPPAPVPPPGLPRFTEPEMRRWPHPPEPAAPPPPVAPPETETLAELQGLLARQAQLLEEIKGLLEELARSGSAGEDKK